MGTRRRRISAQDRRQQIIQAAMPLFARQGFQGTTTRQISDRVGINEALLFRHFPRKEDLYWAVIEHECSVAKGQGEARERPQSIEDDRKFFSALAEEVLRRNSQDSRLSRLLLFSALENHRLSHRFFRTYVANYYECLADHIRKRIREGSFRRVDPLLAARGFLGMVVYHFLIQELFGGKRYQRFDPKKVSAVLADIWLEGMRPRCETQAAATVRAREDSATALQERFTGEIVPTR